ncbi:MAG TPA: DUF6807 family protein [Verrucomicrobiales bacterium]|nr:DUF6807 family protein [Verrucomicrobiales bacterium]
MKTRAISFSFVFLMTALIVCAQEATLVLEREENRIVARTAQGPVVAEYRLQAPPDAGLTVESGGFFHPLSTPGGAVATDLAPPDHPHHRGVFLAWVEMHGTKDADFWGWGEHAPVRDRRIVHREAELLQEKGAALRFRVRNAWEAEGEELVKEVLTATLRAGSEANVLDLEYAITPAADLTLSRWAFSGFCLRLRRDGDLTLFSPSGVEERPNPSHVDPESDWPDAAWYAGELKLADGSVIGAAVINHPGNPPTLWHNHRDVRMINPCIVAPAEVRLKGGEDLKLRYRVATFDGAVRPGLLNRLAAEWRAE